MPVERLTAAIKKWKLISSRNVTEIATVNCFSRTTSYHYGELNCLFLNDLVAN